MTVKNNSTLETDLLGSLIGENIIGERYFKSVFTPANVVKDMIGLLDKDESYFESPGILDRKFLDIQCKSGRFLVEIMNRLLKSNQFNFEFNKAIRNGGIDATEYEASELGKREFIIDRCLYAICPDFMTSMTVSRNLTGDAFRFDNAAVVDSDSDNKVPTAAQSFEALKEMLKSKGEENMTFDVVVGNPPYNDGMDIDFVFGAFEISKDYVLMITPAKWQTAEANQKIQSNHTYGQFREKLVPHMSEVVFYPDCKDVFNDAIQTDGISYYMISKNKSNENIRLKNICTLMPILNCDGDLDRDSRGTLLIKGNNIVKYISPYTGYSVNTEKIGRFSVIISDMIPGSGFYRLSKTNTGVVMISPYAIYDSKEDKVYNSKGLQSGTASSIAKSVFQADSVEECLSFVSWLYSKFSRFFLAMNISTRNWFNDNSMRFVPAPTVLDADGNRVPGKFDHIYTDEELYKTFNLPQEYIDVIEAVIKERKV